MSPEMDLDRPARSADRNGTAASPTFTIAGYYGFGNVGDDSILASMLADLRREFPEARFDILSDRYAPLPECSGATPILWRDWKRVIESVASCRVLIIGGGGLFNSYLNYNSDDLLVQSSNFAPFIFGLPILARLLRRPCCIYGVGASAFNSAAALRHARLAVRLADVCTVRDAATKEILAGDCSSAATITVTADPAFRLDNADPGPLAERLGTRTFHALPRTIVVVIRNWTFGEAGAWEPHLAAALRQFVTQQRLRMLFVPFQSSSDAPFDLSNDRSAIRRISEKLGDAVEYETPSAQLSPGEVSTIISRCAFVIGMRLHACILAVRNAVPFLGLAYDEKVRNVMAHCGLERFVLSPSEITAQELGNALEAVFIRSASIRKEMARVASRMAELACGNVAAVKRALAEPARNPAAEIEFLPFLQELALRQTLLLADSTNQASQLSALVEAGRRAVRALIDAAQFERALECLEQLAAAQPSCGEWHYLKALCLQSLNVDLPRAAECYGRALEAGFDPFWVHYNRSQLNVSMGRLEPARDDLKAAARLNPEHSGIPAVRERIEQATRDGRKQNPQSRL